jgi:hypothetical protein
MTRIRVAHEIVCDRDDAAFVSVLLAAVIKTDDQNVCVVRGVGNCCWSGGECFGCSC